MKVNVYITLQKVIGFFLYKHESKNSFHPYFYIYRNHYLNIIKNNSLNPHDFDLINDNICKRVSDSMIVSNLLFKEAFKQAVPHFFFNKMAT